MRHSFIHPPSPHIHYWPHPHPLFFFFLKKSGGGGGGNYHNFVHQIKQNFKCCSIFFCHIIPVQFLSTPKPPPPPPPQQIHTHTKNSRKSDHTHNRKRKQENKKTAGTFCIRHKTEQQSTLIFQLCHLQFPGDKIDSAQITLENLTTNTCVGISIC